MLSRLTYAVALEQKAKRLGRIGGLRTWSASVVVNRCYVIQTIVAQSTQPGRCDSFSEHTHRIRMWGISMLAFLVVAKEGCASVSLRALELQKHKVILRAGNIATFVHVNEGIATVFLISIDGTNV